MLEELLGEVLAQRINGRLLKRMKTSTLSQSGQTLRSTDVLSLFTSCAMVKQDRSAVLK